MRNERTGRYDYDNMQLLCACGHRLGIHAGMNETGNRPCFNEDTGAGGTGEECDCKNFTPSPSENNK
jgi:hypothetical protein